MSTVAISGAAMVVAAVWALIVVCQVRRIPRVIPLLVLVACWVGVAGLGSSAFATWAGDLGWDRLTIVAVHHAVLMLGAAALATFTVLMPIPAPAGLDEATVREKEASERWWSASTLRTVVLSTGLLIGIMAVTVAVTPPQLRDRLAAMASGDLTGAPVGSSHVAAFFLAGNAHVVVMFAAVTVWATLHLRCRDLVAPLLWGLRVVWSGSVLYVVAGLLLSVSGLIRWGGVAPPSLLGMSGMGFLAVGYVVVLVGVVLPMLLNVVAVVVVVCRHLYQWHALRPLWNELNRVQVPRPQDTAPEQNNDEPDTSDESDEQGKS